MMNVLITGATKGIGKAVAEAFAREGAALALCSRTASDLDLLRQELLKIDPSLHIYTRPTDCSDKTELLAFAKHAKEEIGSMDVLVNNVGTYLPARLLQEEEGLLGHMFATNVYPAYHLSRFFARDMIKRKKGHIFTLCSIASRDPVTDAGSYSVSKFALYGLTCDLRKELEPYGVKVTAVLPGATITNSWEGTTVPDNRFIHPGDVASAILNAVKMSSGACVDEIVIRPVWGNIN
jgi:3-oxoacyl-[acyl-carrier protein] reductase